MGEDSGFITILLKFTWIFYFEKWGQAQEGRPPAQPTNQLHKVHILFYQQAALIRGKS